MLHHQEVIANINDAVEEASNVIKDTKWTREKDFSWFIEDSQDNFIGRVNAKVCYNSGMVTFRYSPNRNTFHSVPRIDPIHVDPAAASDSQERMKISEMDCKIAMVHNLCDEMDM